MASLSTEGLRSESLIIPALHDRQQARGGYLTKGDMKSVAEEVNLPLHKINAVVSFFPHFRTSPPPKVQVHVCRDMACHLNKSSDTIKQVQRWARDKHGDTVEVCGVSCLGRCDRPAAAMINDQLVVHADVKKMKSLVDALVADEKPTFDSDWEIAKQKIGKWDLDPYDDGGRYHSVRRYLEQQSKPESVLSALENAHLLGMGGAGGRAYKKWGDVVDAASTTGNKYIVCNADESEPGTFKDREILLAAPHLVIEGMIVAGLVTGAERGWIYVRHEYPEQIARCKEEIARANKMRVLGTNILDSERSFHLDVFPSPGGYICGEQTALIEAMEGKRAEPRIRPPELQTNGLYQQPTLLSNVETFAWMPAILRDGGDWFAGQGVKSGPLIGNVGDRVKGKRLFSVSGDVTRPGVYEVENGITLGELIDQHCQGMKDKKEIAAVALSGPSGGLLPPKIPIRFLSKRFAEKNPDIDEVDIRNLPLDINVSRAVGYMLGAGIVVYGTGCDVLEQAVANSQFYRNESCGKCVPCRIGSHKITEMGERLLKGQVTSLELATYAVTFGQLGDVMTATSICGLGQVAAAPMQSIIKYFPGVARSHCSDSKTDSTTDGRLGGTSQ